MSFCWFQQEISNADNSVDDVMFCASSKEAHILLNWFFFTSCHTECQTDITDDKMVNDKGWQKLGQSRPRLDTDTRSGIGWSG